MNRTSVNIKDALDHASEVIDLPKDAKFVASPLAHMRLQDVFAYDDPHGWLELYSGDLGVGEDFDEEEQFATLAGYRGEEWANRAMSWVRAGRIPDNHPIVIVDAGKYGSTIGDGRGRLNVAIAMGLRTVPVIVLKLHRSTSKRR